MLKIIKNFKKEFLGGLMILAILLPLVVFGGLVPCGPKELGYAKECDFCQLLVLGQNIVDFLLKKLAPVVAVLALVFGGFLILTARGNSQQISKGKQIIGAAVIGLAIAFGAWLIVDILIRVIADSSAAIPDQAPWWKLGENVRC